MFSKLFELTGLSLVAWGLAWAISIPAGLIFGGSALVLIGATTDDEAVGLAFRRSFGWVRYAWYRQLANENGISVPNLKWPRLPDGSVPCGCAGRDEGCPLCDGLGYIPDSDYRETLESPHPPIKVDPVSEQFWSRRANARRERSKVRDRTPALSRQSPNGDMERLA